MTLYIPTRRSLYSLFLITLLSRSVVVAQGPTISLTPSIFNGYNISCFGARNGAIDATVTGGTTPYTYSWSNGAATQDLANLASGYYKLTVTDASLVVVEADITLTEPTTVKITTTASSYPNGFNVSCYDCYNGSIGATVTGGVLPYAYSWLDGPTTEDRSSLGANKYKLKVTDANGCIYWSEMVFLTQPDRNDWTMSGNANTDPATQYLGSSDAKDVVFKSNGTEALRLKSNGDIKLLGSLNTSGFVYRLTDGTLRAGIFHAPPNPPGLCNDLSGIPFWETQGNTFVDPLCDDPRLGTLSSHSLRVVTDGIERMIVTTTGKVGIGTDPPSGPIDGYRLFVEDGIATRDVLVKLGAWPDYVFKEGYHLLDLAELKDYLHANGHLPGIPSAAAVAEKGGVELGDLQRRMLETIEQQTLYILQMEERMKAMEQRMRALETSK
ncbi:MAG: SprB repeat-containing protein [Flavobacteriales bacterium]